jgi:hypothetical protein
VGVNYAMVISTNAGLWRYKIGDTIMFTSVNPFRIRVTGRTKHFINSVGEELMIDNAERGLKKACEVCHAEISDYTAGPVYMDGPLPGCHEWIIEFSKAPKDLNHFTNVLDMSLRELNSDYDAKRTNDYNLRLPIIQIAQRGTFYKWMESRGKLGGQHKVPRLSNHRKHVDSVVQFLSKLEPV